GTGIRHRVLDCVETGTRLPSDLRRTKQRADRAGGRGIDGEYLVELSVGVGLHIARDRVVLDIGCDVEDDAAAQLRVVNVGEVPRADPGYVLEITVPLLEIDAEPQAKAVA